jgi:hypothetical protein
LAKGFAREAFDHLKGDLFSLPVGGNYAIFFNYLTILRLALALARVLALVLALVLAPIRYFSICSISKRRELQTRRACFVAGECIMQHCFYLPAARGGALKEGQIVFEKKNFFFCLRLRLLFWPSQRFSVAAEGCARA